MTPTQSDPIAFLTALAGRPPIETHISLVFVGPDTVWKLKKPVRLPFLDFSTLAAREHFIRRERELNAQAAPGLYRDVAALTRAPDGSLALDRPGETIDWVLRMARIPEADFLTAITERGDLTPTLLDAIGDSIAAHHASLPPISLPPIPGIDPADRLRHVATGNALSARAAGLDPATVQTWLDATLALLAARADLLRTRARSGFVRRAHGDLHLGNLCLWHGAPVPFDALEFDEDLATIDLGYDLAFLLMDLDRRAGRPAANRVLNRYLARTGDWDLPALLPPFLSLRAMIRAHVAASRSQPEDAQAYLQAALAAAHPAPARMLAIGGIPGTGKSTLARAIAPKIGAAPGAVILRSDEIRKRQHGVAPEHRLPPAAYTPQSSARVFAELTEAAHRIAGAGHAVVADATFMDPAHRAAIEAAAAGAPFLGIWLTAPLALLEARIAARTADASDADLAILRRAAAADSDAPAWLHVDSSTEAAALAALSKAIRNRAGPC